MSTTKNTLVKNLYFLLIADFISSFGSLMTGTAITLIVFQRTGDLLVTALFTLAVLIPKTIIAPFVGRLKIKMSFRRLFCAGELICGLLLGILLIYDGMIIIFLTNAVHGIVFFVLESYRAEFLKMSTDDRTIYHYQSISRMVNVAVTVLAPLVSGAVLAYMANAKLIYLIDVISYVLAAVIISFINGNLFPIAEKNEETLAKAKFKNIVQGRAYIYIGSTVVMFAGGITSLLTLSYVMVILKLGEFQYSVLMSLMALGSFIGSFFALIPIIQQKLRMISGVSTCCMGLLLLSVLLVPEFYPMCGICLISGILSSMVMVFYSTELYQRYEQSEIRAASAYLEICTGATTMTAKPIAGFLEKMIGTIWGLACMGILFVIITPINCLSKKKIA